MPTTSPSTNPPAPSPHEASTIAGLRTVFRALDAHPYEDEQRERARRAVIAHGLAAYGVLFLLVGAALLSGAIAMLWLGAIAASLAFAACSLMSLVAAKLAGIAASHYHQRPEAFRDVLIAFAWLAGIVIAAVLAGGIYVFRLNFPGLPSFVYVALGVGMTTIAGASYGLELLYLSSSFASDTGRG